MINFASQSQEALNSIIELHKNSKNIKDPEISNILVNLTHWCTQLFTLILQQNSQLIPHLSQLENNLNQQVNIIQHNIQQFNNKLTNVQNETCYQLKQGEYHSLYELIADELQINSNDIKTKIHQYLQVKDSNQELFYSSLLEKGNYNKQILYLIAKHFNISIFIFSAKTQQKIFMGDKQNKLISIYQMKKACAKLKSKQRKTNIQVERNEEVPKTKTKYQGIQQTTSIHQKNNQNQQKAQEQSKSKQMTQSQRKDYDSEAQISAVEQGLICEQCEAGPFKSQTGLIIHHNKKHKKEDEQNKRVNKNKRNGR